MPQQHGEPGPHGPGAGDRARVGRLLRATAVISQELSVETVLHNVVEAACHLVGARYGALGVIGPDGGLERFVHLGVDEATVARIGALPEGRGLLGALVTDRRPIRLPRMGDDPRSVGLPPGHPPMASFLGVPIDVHGAVYGTLYLAGSEAGEFSAEDEELVTALAVAAGSTLHNARLYDEAQRQQRWLAASADITSQVLAPGSEEPLHVIAGYALDIAGADLVSVALLTDDGSSLVIEEVCGQAAPDLLGRRFPLGATVSGLAVELQRPLLLADADEHPQRTSHLSAVVDAGPLMVVPLQGAERIRGVLSVVRRKGRPRFSESDLAMATGFANHASVALELADSRLAEQKVILLEDRDRIARDLHDHVIQELFAVGLGLESIAAVLGPQTALGQRVQLRVEDVDRTIRRIRTSIFGLRGALGAPEEGLRTSIVEITSDLTPVLGFPPHVTFSGLIDLVTDPDLAADVAAVVREALTNVAKHARASTASVDVSASATELAVVVTDDGSWTASGRSSGTTNLRTRAETRGGSFDIASSPAGGTRLSWKVPRT